MADKKTATKADKKVLDTIEVSAQIHSGGSYKIENGKPVLVPGSQTKKKGDK